MSTDITIPDFLTESPNDVHARMLAAAPSDISTFEGDMFWNATSPVAQEIAKAMNIGLQGILRLGILQTATGEYLDLKGSENGMTRKSATYAIQSIKFIGKVGTEIAAGKIIATPATDIEDSIEFSIVEKCNIGFDGTITVNAKCLIPGTTGNVAIGNITILTTSINGISSVSNIEIIEEGTEEECDDDFRDRILAKAKAPGTSGNKYDYLNWALEVDNVGAAKVFPLWNGTETVNGAVTIVIADVNKKAASLDLIKETYDHIEEFRPIGATVTVKTAVEKPLDVTATISIERGLAIETVETEFTTLLTKYLESVAFDATYISIAKIGDILLNTTGVLDINIEDLKVNGLASNITLKNEEIAVVGTVNLGGI